MFGKKRFELESVRRQKSAEADAMMRLHGCSFTDACRTVALSPADYIKGERPIDWLPSPEQIDEFARAVRNGDVAVGERVHRSKTDLLPMEPKQDELDSQYELADRIPEDDYELPAWFGSSP